MRDRRGRSSPRQQPLPVPQQRLQPPHRNDKSNGPRKRRFKIVFALLIPGLFVMQYFFLYRPLLILQQEHEAAAPSNHSVNLLQRKRPTPTSTSSLKDSRQREEPLQQPKISGLSPENLNDYNAAAQPPLVPASFYTPSADRPLSVVVVRASTTTAAANSTSSPLVEALDQSQFVQVVEILSYNSSTASVAVSSHRRPSAVAGDDEPLVYLVDWASLEHDCHVLSRILYQHPPPSRIQSSLLILYDDSIGSENVDCSESFLNPFLAVNSTTPELRSIRIAKRRRVQGRFWNETLGWVQTGRLSPLVSTLSSSAIHATTSSLPWSLVQRLEHITRTQFSSSKDTPIHNLATSHDRNMDVVLFLPGTRHYSRLRHRVREVITTEINGTARGVSDNSPIRCRVVGDEDEEYGYLEHLLSSKIVVVTQHDEWEDDSALLQGLASGALVMTDVMLALPPDLQNASHLVVYDSASSLSLLLKYYLHLDHEQARLSIAQKGHQVAMNKYQTSQRVGTILFGLGAYVE